jgi:hypothetical protein
MATFNWSVLKECVREFVLNISLKNIMFSYGIGEERIKIANDNCSMNGMYREEKLKELPNWVLEI